MTSSPVLAILNLQHEKVRISVKNRLMSKISSYENDDKLEPDHHVGLCLPKLPAHLETLNGRTLQSVIIAITKDLKISWDGEKPVFWPEKIPFS